MDNHSDIHSDNSDNNNDDNNIFLASKENNVDNIYKLLKKGCNPNQRDENGCTPLHICSTFGCSESALMLLKWKSDYTLQDYENGWTPLHRSIYFGHLPITILLLKAGAKLTINNTIPNKIIEERSIKNISNWISPLDHEGNCPLDLLTLINKPKLSQDYQNKFNFRTELVVYGKADFFLGIPLPRATPIISKPRPILTLENEQIVDIVASKFHTAAITNNGNVYTWGLGKDGRLGHGNELNLPSPTLIQFFFGKLFNILLLFH